MTHIVELNGGKYDGGTIGVTIDVIMIGQDILIVDGASGEELCYRVRSLKPLTAEFVSQPTTPNPQ